MELLSVRIEKPKAVNFILGHIEGKSFVYSDRQNPDEVAVITISDLKAGVRIVLVATGNYGVTSNRGTLGRERYASRSENDRTHPG